MRICYLGTATTPHPQKMVTYFAARGHDVHLIAFDQPNREFEGVKLHILYDGSPTAGKRDDAPPLAKRLFLQTKIVRTLRVKKIIDEIQPDIVHAHYVSVYGIIGWMLNFHPLVISAWGSDVLIDLKKRFYVKYRILNTLALKHADRIHCGGNNTRNVVMSLGINPEHVLLAPFGVDVERFTPKDYNTPTTGKREVKVVSTRMHYPIYDLPTLLEAASIVLEKQKETRFIIAGEGPLTQELEKYAETLGIRERVDFIGFITADRMIETLSTSDIYVATALSDAGLSVSAAEAMACGLPVIVTDFGENKEWVQNGENGFVIPVRSPEILAEKILYLIENENARREFGEKNREIIVERYNYAKEMEKVEQFYIDLLRDRGT
jgi:L-malate glycosyltransferase